MNDNQFWIFVGIRIYFYYGISKNIYFKDFIFFKVSLLFKKMEQKEILIWQMKVNLKSDDLQIEI